MLLVCVGRRAAAVAEGGALPKGMAIVGCDCCQAALDALGKGGQQQQRQQHSPVVLLDCTSGGADAAVGGVAWLRARGRWQVAALFAEEDVRQDPGVLRRAVLAGAGACLVAPVRPGELAAALLLMRARVQA